MKLEATFFCPKFQRTVYRFPKNKRFILQKLPSSHFKTTNANIAILVKILYNYKTALIQNKKDIVLSRFGAFTFV